MRFEHRAWVPAAWITSLLNVGAVWFAAAAAEPLHATIHAALGAALGVAARHLGARRRAAELHGDLQQALDANEEQQRIIEETASLLQALESRVDAAERLMARRDPPAGAG
jgi:hypothetical protein